MVLYKYIYVYIYLIIVWQNDPNDANGPDLDTKIDELQESVRKSEVILKIKFHQ